MEDVSKVRHGVRIPDREGEIRLFATVRNEAARLPYFLRYYAERGVARFFVIDNGSSDATMSILANTPNLHVFRAEGSYAEAGCGILWIRRLLDEYGCGHWCVVVDADEILMYPDWERRSLPDLCASLREEGATALPCLLLDMYSDAPFAETHYEPGSNPLALCPYFETATIICWTMWPEMRVQHWRHVGGMRSRVFEIKPRLDKVSLLFHSASMKLGIGMHDLANARFSRARGAIFHFKYFSDFAPCVQREAIRGEHWSGAWEYQRYADVVKLFPAIGAWSPISERFTHSGQLLSTGVLRAFPSGSLDW